ncbi:MAG: hypothetical protein A2X36_05935 [Elusimicrobia bacterium GWA2_69_24]|nr:MAG: hypothetical protein A2X36_05935 [Elusimicrobia bacterium GWA2_69_24]HBL17298.1 hypothetical protein [Elusimicrobiota bacterium]
MISARWALGLLALFPAVSLWISWPRRRLAAWVAAGGCLVLWLLMVPVAEPALRRPWALAGLGSLFACFYATFVVLRNSREYERLDSQLNGRRTNRDKLRQSLDAAQSRSRDIETEQREVLALYGMVKGLSEAMTWEDIRPKIEIAVEQYLRVEEFSIFVSEEGAPDRPKLLVRRKLASSVGASWETLQRYLQEHDLPLTVPHSLRSPEAAVALPIFESQKFMGYFYARLPRGMDAETLLAKAQSFVEEISFAFRRVKLFNEMEQQSQVDGLTGVYRRRVLDDKLLEEVLRAETFKMTFCLMILDIDHFKSLNDEYGHQFGDQVLQKIGEILRESVYETDFVARYGGEEFAILLPRAESAGVLRKAEAVRKAIESAVFELAMQKVQVTVSIGIAHYPRDGKTAAAVIQRADQALYHAKESGRNRVVDIAEVRKLS